MKDTIYQFIVKNTQGEDVPLTNFKGKVVLIVNTASKCGFTPQLTGMQKLYEDYKDQGFEILAFPSNDFANQEPLEGEALAQFCMVDYQAEYPIFDKMNVKGKNASELYQFLSDKRKNGKVNSKPKWNFHKYLINKEGKVDDYFLTITNPNSPKVRKKIEKLLK